LKVSGLANPDRKTEKTENTANHSSSSCTNVSREEKEMDFEKCLKDTPRNNRIMQRTLRELDFSVLVMALAGLPDAIRQYVYRNVSRVTAETLRGEVKSRESSATDVQKKEAAEVFNEILTVIYKELENFSPPAPSPGAIPQVKLETKREIVDLFFALAELARDQGLLALQDVDASENQLLEKGIEMAVNGWDPSLLLPILERTKKTMIQSIDEKLSMIIEGVESIQLGDHPRAIAAKLEAYLPD
jgi:hypothetical protein